MEGDIIAIVFVDFFYESEFLHVFDDGFSAFFGGESCVFSTIFHHFSVFVDDGFYREFVFFCDIVIHE